MFTVLLFGLIGLVIGFVFSGGLISMITTFLGINAVSLKPTDAFNTFLTLSFLSGLTFALPVFIIQLNLFIRKGLKENERKILDKVSVLIPPLFVAGAIAGTIVAIYSLQFFQGFSTGIGLEAYWGIETVISHISSLLILFAAMFVVIPIVIYLLIRFFNVRKKDIVYASGLGFPVIALGSAYITPPDVFSQIALMLPVYLLIGLTLLLTKGGDKNGNRTN